MNLLDYIAMGEIHTLSADDAQSLNVDLSARSHSDIPAEFKDRVADYIIAAINMESVDPKLLPKIENLLKDLQQGN